MRKARQKALKVLFKNTFNRPVKKGPQVVSAMGENLGYIPSEWRRLKKAHLAEARGR